MADRKRRETLIYSLDFREAVKKAYQNSEIVTRLLEEKSFTLGHYLDEGGFPSIPVSVVVSMLEAGETEKLLKLAKEAEEKRRLYELWLKEVYEEKH
jgi:hypothetical protein